MVTIIVPHHLNENQHLLDWCLESILKQDVEKEVIVVADTVDQPRVPNGVILHWAADNRFAYCSRKFNFGFRIADTRSTHIFTCADDIILGRNVLCKMQQASGKTTLINALSNCDDINILSQTISTHMAPLWRFPKELNEQDFKNLQNPDYRQFIHYLEPSGDHQFVIGTNRIYLYATMLPRRAIEVIGPMDENFEAGWEDEDYCIRASMHKFLLGIDTSSYIFHIGGQTLKYSEHNPKNREYFKNKWGIDLLPAAAMAGYGAIVSAAQKMNEMGVTVGGYNVTMGTTDRVKS